MNQRPESLSTRALLILLLVLAALYLAGFVWQLLINLADIILLFFLAWLLSMLLTPVVVWLERRRLPSGAAVALVYLGLTLLLALLIMLLLPSLFIQLVELGRSLPDYVRELPNTVERFQAWLAQQGIRVELLPLVSTDLLTQRAEALGTAFAQFTFAFVQGTFSVFLGTVIVVILSIYFTIDRQRLAQGVLGLLPTGYREEGRFFMDRLGLTFGAYLRGMVILALIYGIGNAAVMLFFGVQYVAAVSIFAGLMMFIPFLGTILAIIPPVIIALFTISTGQALLVAVALFVLQQVVLNGIAPRVLSQSVGIHPLLVFLALLLGVKLAGFWGALFGVPVVAVIYSMAAFFYERGQAGGPQPPVAEAEPAGQSILEPNEEA